MIKKLYQVVESRPATAYWVYAIEAESEEEARRLVEELDFKPTKEVDHSTEIDWDGDAEFEYGEMKVIEK
jgi:hypothetical protein